MPLFDVDEPLRMAVDDAEWLLIRFERAAHNAADRNSTMQDVVKYGELRGEILRRLRALDSAKGGAA
jgi:hypothetical protein